MFRPYHTKLQVFIKPGPSKATYAGFSVKDVIPLGKPKKTQKKIH